MGKTEAQSGLIGEISTHFELFLSLFLIITWTSEKSAPGYFIRADY